MNRLICDRCTEPIGAPHRLLDTDCILGHVEHVNRAHGYACQRHYHWIDRTLQQIEQLFALTNDVLIPGPSTSEIHGSRSGSPAPGRVEVMALTDPRAKTPVDLEPEDIPDLPGTLASWARLVVKERESRIEVDGTVTVSVRVLRHERLWITAREWLDDYVTELGDLHRIVARAVGDSMWPQPIGDCPNCGAPMYPTIGVDEAHCRRCKATWRGIALARLRLIHDQDRGAATARR